MILYFRPAAQLPTSGAERPALSVRGGADAAPAAGGARELPAGTAPVQLSASVQCSPVLRASEMAWASPPYTWWSERDHSGWWGLLPGIVAILPCGKKTRERGVLGDANIITQKLQTDLT